MEEGLRVLVNFNERIVRKQQWEYFYYSWKKKLPAALRNVFCVLLVIFIFDSLIGDKNRYDFLQFALIFLGIAFVMYLISFYYQKANYSIKIDKNIDELKEYHPVTELYFNEESFHIKSEQNDIRCIWEKITYEIFGTTILIHIDMGTPVTFLISKEDTDQYAEILNFLKRKTKAKNK